MIISAQQANYKDIIKFENKVFKRPFKLFMAKLYKNRPEKAELHGVYIKNDKIRAAIAVVPSDFKSDDYFLKAVGVGSVAVDKKYRGRGLMKELLNYADNVAKREKADIAFLSGHRARYERFGYMPAGLVYEFDIDEYAVNKAKVSNNLKLLKVNKNSKEIETMADIYAQGAGWLRKKNEFYDILRTWCNTPYAVIKEEKTVGYIISSKGQRGKINEITVTGEVSAVEVAAAFMKKKALKGVSVCTYAFKAEQIKDLSAVCEHFSLKNSESIKIYDFAAFIKKGLVARALKGDLASGRVVISIDNEVLAVSVSQNSVSVERTEDAPQIMWTRAEATVALTTGVVADKGLIRAWLPVMPIAVPPCDKV